MGKTEFPIKSKAGEIVKNEWFFCLEILEGHKYIRGRTLSDATWMGISSQTLLGEQP